MTARVIAIGLDAAEATLIERWAADGVLKTFSRLLGRANTYRLDNSLNTLPGAIWPELMTGRSCGKDALYYHPSQLHTGEAKRRPVAPEEVDHRDFYWTAASEAGLRVAAVDQVQAVLVPDFNGMQLLEWGTHDRPYGLASDPERLAGELTARFGPYPVDTCDKHGCKTTGYRALLDGLLAGAKQKTRIMLDILGRERWDLFTCSFGESHCAGHQFWRFFDPDYEEYERASPDLLDALQAVYRQIDQGLGALIDAAGPEATVIVYTSHGMGPYLGGYQLLPEFLVRLGLSSDEGKYGAGPTASRLARAQTWFSHLPRRYKAPLRPFLQNSLAHGISEKLGRLSEPLESPQAKAAALTNNRCGAIRLNLKGREPHGCVAKGNEATSLLQEIRDELAALKDPATGEKIVMRVVSAEEAFGPDHHQDVPDLMIDFRTDLGRIETCESDRVGRIAVPVFHPNIPRSGDHTEESRLWIAGPDIISGQEQRSANVLDLAPTILSLLDVPITDRIDGAALDIFQQPAPDAAPSESSNT